MITRTAARRRSLRAAVGVAVLGVVAGLLLPVAPFAAAPQAQAVKASGGVGQYTQAIEWFSWGAEGEAVTNGTRTNVSTVDGLPLAITCTISKLSGGLVSYSPGTWRGDAFDELYNSGSTGAANTLDVGLRPNTDGATRTFDLACSATFNGVNLPLAGLVFADAEQSGNLEHVGATAPSGSIWRLIDRYRSAGCDQTSYAYRPSSNTTRLELYGPASATCDAGPSVVALAQGAQSFSTVTVRGAGLSAIALGVMVTLDFGDAPASYGQAGAVLQAQYQGGDIPTTTGGWTTTNRGVDAFSRIGLATPSAAVTSTVGSLGAIIDGELAAFDSAGTGDDTTGLDDEDAQFTFPSPVDGAATTSGTLRVGAYPGQSYSTTVTCTGAGAVRGWIDWARDGSFGTGDASQQTVCANGAATLTWSVPASAVASPSYIRLRMGAAGTALQPTGIIAVGEVEDHPIVISMPRIALTKTTSLGDAVGRPGQTVRYTVTLTNAGDARATSVGIADDLSDVLAGASYVPNSAVVTTPRGSTGTLNLSGTTPTWGGWNSDLRPGESIRITYDFVLGETARGRQLTNTATGSAGVGIGRITANATVAFPVAVTLELRKTWIVDGVSYVDGTQPSGISATATATGPGSGASPIAWSTRRDGYVVGTAVQIAETTTIDPSLACTATGTATVDGVQRPMPDEIVLRAPHTVVEVTNTLACDTRLTLHNEVGFGTADPDQWTLSATGPTAGGPSGASGVSALVQASAPYALTQAGGPATYTPRGPWVCLDADTNTPVALESGSVRVPLGTHLECTVVQSTAQLILLKSVVNDNGGTLTSGAFRLTADPAHPDLTATTVDGDTEVTALNTFEVRPDHAYALSEDMGDYAYLGQSIERYVGPTGATSAQLADAGNWQPLDPAQAAAVTVPIGERGIYRFVNDDAPALTLPLTGGIGADTYLFGGAGLLLFGLLAVAIHLVRTRIRSDREARLT